MGRGLPEVISDRWQAEPEDSLALRGDDMDGSGACNEKLERSRTAGKRNRVTAIVRHLERIGALDGVEVQVYKADSFGSEIDRSESGGFEPLKQIGKEQRGRDFEAEFTAYGIEADNSAPHACAISRTSDNDRAFRHARDGIVSLKSLKDGRGRESKWFGAQSRFER